MHTHTHTHTRVYPVRHLHFPFTDSQASLLQRALSRKLCSLCLFQHLPSRPSQSIPWGQENGQEGKVMLEPAWKNAGAVHGLSPMSFQEEKPVCCLPHEHLSGPAMEYC